MKSFKRLTVQYFKPLKNKKMWVFVIFFAVIAITIEGYTMSSEGMKRTPAFYDNIDHIMRYFDELLKELDRTEQYLLRRIK